MINVGIIGTGVGVRTHLPAFRMVPGVRVKGIAGRTHERAVSVAASCGLEVGYRDYVALCEDPDISLVCVTSPNPHHIEHVLCAVQNGKSVICEKPLAMQLDEYDSIIRASKEMERGFIVVNHQLRFNPYVKKIREILESGALGKVFYCRLHQQGTAFANRNMPWSWSFDGSEGGGVRLAMGSHLLDLLQTWFGRSVTQIGCDMSAVIPTRLDQTGEVRRVTGSAFCTMHVKALGGVVADLTATAAAHGGSAFDISIYGDRGEMQFDLVNKLRLSTEGGVGRWNNVEVDSVFDDEKANRVSIFSGSFRYCAGKFVEAAETGNLGGISEACTLEQSRYTQTILDAALTAYRRSRTVDLNRDGVEIEETL